MSAVLLSASVHPVDQHTFAATLSSPDSDTSRLILEVKTRPPNSSRQTSSSTAYSEYNSRSRSEGRYVGNDDCIVSVFSGVTCHVSASKDQMIRKLAQYILTSFLQSSAQKRFSLDMYRQAYESSQRNNYSAAGRRDESGVGDDIGDLETMKVTVKDPSVAFRYIEVKRHAYPLSADLSIVWLFRLLEPLDQAFDACDNSKPLSDYVRLSFP